MRPLKSGCQGCGSIERIIGGLGGELSLRPCVGKLIQNSGRITWVNDFGDLMLELGRLDEFCDFAPSKIYVGLRLLFW